MFTLQAIHYASSRYICLPISQLISRVPSSVEKASPWDFPINPGVKMLHFQCKGHSFNPWSGSLDSTCHMAWSKKRKESLTLAFKVFEADSVDALSHTLSAIMNTPEAIDGHDSQPVIKFSFQAPVFLLSMRHFPKNCGVQLAAYSSNPDRDQCSYLTPQSSTNAE